MGRRRRLSREAFDGKGSRARAAATLRALAVLAAIALTLVFASSALAGEGDQITGTVTNSATKAPIQSVEVCAGRFVYEQKCVSTGADGTYVVPAQPVPVHVEFNAPPGSGLVSRTFYNGAYIPSEATELTVPVGEVFSGIDEELLPEGRIEGVVTNASTKAPIAAAEVCASPSAAWPEEPTCMSTNAEGVYEFFGLAPVSYTVKFKPGGLNYLPETPQRYYERGAQVSAGGTTANIDAALPEGAQIGGHVASAATGLPVSGVQACATGFGPVLETKCAKTDVEGNYLIDGLETSSYYMSFWPERPYVGQRYDDAKPMWVNQGETLAGINASVLTGTTISGDVTSASTGKPMEAGEVEVCLSERVKEEFDGMAPREETSGYCTEPNQNGEYQITGVATSTDQVEFHPKPSDYEYENQYWSHVGVSTESTELHTTAGETITGIDAALEAKYGVIAGTAIDTVSKAAIGEIWVCALQVGGSQAERCTKTDANGRYMITGLKSGEYTVEFYSYPSARYPVRYYGGGHTRSEAQHVKVSVGVTTAEIDAELIEPESAGSHIRGAVSSASGGQPIAGIEVCAYDAAEEAGLFGRCATTEAGGEYSISGLSSGEYLVEFSSPYGSGLNYVTQYYNGVASPEKATAVTVGPETVDIGIDARMSEGGRIGGEVTDASTPAPIQGISACAYAEESETLVGACANTGQNGQYTIAGLPAGEYTVEFSSPYTGELDYVRQYFNGQSVAKTATLVHVTVGATSSGVNASMRIGGRVTGRVRTAATGPLTNVLVCALADPSKAVECALSNRNGEYAIAGVPAGSYVIGFQATKPYKVQYYNNKLSFSEAQVVSVTAGGTTTNIDAAMSSSDALPPANTKPPVVLGVPAIGETLLCADGLWTGSPTPSLTDRWLRDGSPISGATVESYTVMSADAGHSLTCEVMAKSSVGEQSAVSAGMAIPGSPSIVTPTTGPALSSPFTTSSNTPTMGGKSYITGSSPITITTSTLSAARGLVRVRVQCGEERCADTVELTVRAVTKLRTAGRRVSHATVLVLAKGSLSLTGEGKSASIVLRLTPAGSQWLAHADRLHPVAAQISVSAPGFKSIVVRSVQVT